MTAILKRDVEAGLDLYDRLTAYTSAPDLYDPPTLGELQQLARLYLIAKVEVAPALRREADALPRHEDCDDLRDMLEACAEDLEGCTQ